MQVENYKQFGGTVFKLAAIRHVAGYFRVIGRQTSSPLTESMLFGVAGGVGAAYSLPRSADGPRPRIDLGPRYKGRAGEPLQALCVRLGLPASFRHTGSRTVAEHNAWQALDRGEPVILYGHAAHLPHLAWPGYGDPLYVGVLYGIEGQGPEARASLADISPEPITLSAATLLEARGAPPELRHLSVGISAPAAPVDLPKAFEGGLRACCDRMIDPPHPKSGFGLRALTRLAHSVASTHDVEGWPTLFPPGAPLLNALLTLFSAIDLGESGPTGGRAMFAEFLREASAVLQGPDLGEAIDHYEALALAWQGLSEAALPDDCAPLAELRRLLSSRLLLLQTRGPSAQPELETIRDRVAELTRQLSADFPLDQAGRTTLLSNLQERLTALAMDEESAIRGLRLLLR